MSEEDTARQLEAINSNFTRQMSDYFLKVCFKSFGDQSGPMSPEQLQSVLSCQTRMAHASHLIVPAVYHGMAEEAEE